MGNVALCAPAIISSAEIKIICCDGRLASYTRAPIKAAEIMLENPGRFLCESGNLKVGLRIAGMCAEEELERGRVYFLLPMEMLYSVLTDEEFNALSTTTTTRHRTASSSRGVKQQAISFSKIFPEFCLFPNGSEGKAAAELAADGGGGAAEGVERYSRQRSWQPALETIVETPPRTN